MHDTPLYKKIKLNATHLSTGIYDTPLYKKLKLNATPLPTGNYDTPLLLPMLILRLRLIIVNYVNNQ